MKKRFISIFLVICMVACLLPANVFATDWTTSVTTKVVHDPRDVNYTILVMNHQGQVIQSVYYRLKTGISFSETGKMTEDWSVTNYTYDGQGNVCSAIEEANGETTLYTYQYDLENQRIYKYKGATRCIEYDMDGKILRSDWDNPRMVEAYSIEGESYYQYEYDYNQNGYSVVSYYTAAKSPGSVFGTMYTHTYEDGRLTDIGASNGGMPWHNDQPYTYDSNGIIVAAQPMDLNNSVFNFIYDNSNKVTGIEMVGKKVNASVQFTYDSNGLTRIIADGRTVYASISSPIGPDTAAITSLYPASGSTFDFSDTSSDTRMRIFFDREVSDGDGGRPELDFNVGTLEIHKASDDSIVYQVQYGTEVSLWNVDGSPMAVVLKNATAALDYDTEYYVTMPEGFIKMADGTVSPAIEKGEWQFTTSGGQSLFYEFSYDLDGGTWNEPDVCVPYEKSETVSITTEVPAKSGYTFTGWSDGSTTYQPGDTFAMPEHDVVLTAVWEPKSYYLTYDLGGVGPYPATSHLVGETITIPSEAPEKEGFVFGGWFDGSTTYQLGESFTMPAHNVTLTAMWSEFVGPPTPYYTVSYNLNGGIGDIPSEQVVINGTVTITSIIPTKEGYQFAGWSDGVTTYQPGAPLEKVKHDVVLTAVWEELPKVTYSVEKALTYARNHWNDGVGECANFVSRCVIAGGLEINIDNGTSGCIDKICNVTGLEAQPLQTQLVSGYMRVLQSDNPGMIAPGDVVIQWCNTHNKSPHVLICGGFNTKKVATYYAHASAKNNQGFAFNYSYVVPNIPPRYDHTVNCEMTAKVIRLSTLSQDTQCLAKTTFHSDCPVEMVMTINNEALDSRTISDGTISNSFATMGATGTGPDREIAISVLGDSISNHDVQLELLGTGSGQMTLNIAHTYNDGSIEKYTFQNIALNGTSIGYLDSMEPGLLTRLIMQNTENNSSEVWVAYPDECIDEPTPERFPIEQSKPNTPNIPVFGSTEGTSTPTIYSITIPTVTGGKVTATPTSASKGTTVTFTVTPDTGYELTTLTATDSSSNKLILTDKGSGKYTFTMPASNVTVSAIFAPTFPEPAAPTENTSNDEPYLFPFTDVLKTDWFCDAVEYVFNNDLMSGTAPYTFDPQGKMNRAMVWTVLGRMAEANVDGSDSPWYAKAQVWAMTNNVSDGTNPDNSISRQELTTMLWRYIGSPAANADLSGFSDIASVANWASSAMQWAVSTGLIVGDNGRLNPTGNAKRCEVAAIFMRFCENIAE